MRKVFIFALVDIVEMSASSFYISIIFFYKKNIMGIWNQETNDWDGIIGQKSWSSFCKCIVYVITPSPTKLWRDIVMLPSVRPSVTSFWTLESASFNGFWPNLVHTVLERIWNPIDFQGQRSRSPGQIFRRGDMPRFALPLFGLYF